MHDKSSQLKELLLHLKRELAVESMLVKRSGVVKDVGLVNQFKLHTFIPNKWFDWERHLNSEIMIIGQDWGPYSALLPYIKEYDEQKSLSNFDYDKLLFSRFSSRTEKFIVKAIEGTYASKYSKVCPESVWDNFFFTMAVLFTRKGKHFRGNEYFDSSKSAEISYPYVSKQISIVKPKVIMTLGALAFDVVNKYFNLGEREKRISEIIMKYKSTGFIKTLNGTYVIPNYHPAAHVNPKVQLKIWSKLWGLI